MDQTVLQPAAPNVLECATLVTASLDSVFPVVMLAIREADVMLVSKTRLSISEVSQEKLTGPDLDYDVIFLD